MSNTTLWYVGHIWDGEQFVIKVSKERFAEFRLRMRTITGNAAGRRYKRNNLAHMVSSERYETENPNSPTFGIRPTLKEMKKVKSLINNATIEVVK